MVVVYVGSWRNHSKHVRIKNHMWTLLFIKMQPFIPDIIVGSFSNCKSHIVILKEFVWKWGTPFSNFNGIMNDNDNKQCSDVQRQSLKDFVGIIFP